MRYIDYSSVYKVKYEIANAFGSRGSTEIKVKSTHLRKFISLRYDALDYQSTILHAQIAYRLENRKWATKEEFYGDKMQEILSRENIIQKNSSPELIESGNSYGYRVEFPTNPSWAGIHTIKRGSR